jgi:hypothetical protein
LRLCGVLQISSLQRQGTISAQVKKKMKGAVAHGMADEVRRLLKLVTQQQHRDSLDREDSLFASYKCPLTDDLLYEPVRRDKPPTSIKFCTPASMLGVAGRLP